MKNYLLIALLIIAQNGFCQAENEAIKNSINQFFDGMKKNDTLLIKSSLDATCFLYSISQKKDGSTQVEEQPISAFLQQVASLKGQQLDERLLSFDIKVDGAMAIAWTPYKFYFNEKFSHCGVNVFTLVRKNDQWKIMGITDTRRKQGCE